MKKIIIAIAFFIGMATQIHAQTINVATYNIRINTKGDSIRGNGWHQRCPVICDLIRFHDFDIFGSQEVRAIPLGEMLAGLPGYSYIGVGRDDGKMKGEFTPIFYKTDRFKLVCSGHFWLSQKTDVSNKGWDAALARICTWGGFKDNKNGKKFWFFNTHMDHIGVVARRESAKLIMSKIKEIAKNDPVILTGDFNIDQTDESYALFNTSGQLRDTYQTAAIKYAPNGTFNDFNPNLGTDSRIDHIFINKAFTALRYGILTDTYRAPKQGNSQAIKSTNFPSEVSLYEQTARLPSDHYPIMVVLSY